MLNISPVLLMAKEVALILLVSNQKESISEQKCQFIGEVLLFKRHAKLQNYMELLRVKNGKSRFNNFFVFLVSNVLSLFCLLVSLALTVSRGQGWWEGRIRKM